jgi:single-strand DNA-binding protein
MMANDMNVVVLVGRLTRDMELKFLNNGTPIGSFSIAVGRVRTENERKVDEVSYFDCSLFGKFAEVMNQYMLKGKQISLTGSLRQDRWEKDGQNYSKVKINVDNIQLLSDARPQENVPRRGETESFHRDRTQYQGARTTAPHTSVLGPESFDDDIPF